MTPQEQQMIQTLADRINGIPLAEKDPEAEQFLDQVLGRNPDALYILAQTTLVQQYALDQAQKQLAAARVELDERRQQAERPKHATSFLGNLLGRHDDPAPAPTPYAPVPDYNQPGYASTGRPYTPGGSSFSGPGYVPVPPPPPYVQSQYVQYGQPQYGQPQYGQPQSGGFLRSAMQTAAGVAAGALAFEGIESLMHGFGGGGMGGERPEEIINNYYGDSAPGEHRDHLSSDIEDRRGDATGFDDAVDRGDHSYGKDDLLETAGNDPGGELGSASGADDPLFADDDNSSDDFASDDSSDSDSSSFDDGN